MQDTQFKNRLSEVDYYKAEEVDGFVYPNSSPKKRFLSLMLVMETHLFATV